MYLICCVNVLNLVESKILLCGKAHKAFLDCQELKNIFLCKHEET